MTGGLSMTDRKRDLVTKRSGSEVSSAAIWDKISASARTLMEDLYFRLGVLQVQQQIWERLLTAEERRQLEPHGWPTNFITMWMRLRKVSQPRAMIEMGRGIGFLSEIDVNWLLPQFGEASPEVQSGGDKSPVKPHWDPVRRELWLGNKLIKKVRSRSIGKNVCPVLDVFEEEGWPARIDSPLDDGKLGETIRSLNTSLTHIRFHSDGDDEGILWEPRRALKKAPSPSHRP